MAVSTAKAVWSVCLFVGHRQQMSRNMRSASSAPCASLSRAYDQTANGGSIRCLPTALGGTLTAPASSSFTIAPGGKTLARLFSRDGAAPGRRGRRRCCRRHSCRQSSADSNRSRYSGHQNRKGRRGKWGTAAMRAAQIMGCSCLRWVQVV
jgi:hypothetical protein